MFDSLTRWDADLAVAPAAAIRWRTSDGGSTWRFTLRLGAAFHDGTPVTATDFVTGWNATAMGAAHRHLADVVGYQGLRAGRARTLAGIEALGRRTVQVRLRTPRMDFPAVAGHPSLAPLPQARDTTQQAFANRPIGNGPFRMAEPWARGRFVRLARVGSPPAEPATSAGLPLDEVVFTVADPETAYLGFAQGRLDVVTIPPAAIPQALDSMPRAAGGRQGPGFIHADAAATTFLVVDTSRPPFDRVVARRALSLALRRDDLAVSAVSGGAEPALTIGPPGIPGARIRTCDACHHDGVAARATLRELTRRPLPLVYPAGTGQERLASRIQEHLAEAGLELRPRAVPFSRYAAALQRGGPGLHRLAWVLDHPTLDNALYPLLHSGQVPPRGANFARYRNPRVDRFLDRARRAGDPEARIELYRRAEDLAAADMAVIPVLTHRHRLAVGARVLGLNWTAMGTVDLRQVRLSAR